MTLTLIDATDLVLGRMASAVAKRLLDGEEITIVNVENAVVSGAPDSTLGRYYARTRMRSITNPRKLGPFHPKAPDKIARRTVRGMLPYKRPRGRAAYRRLKVCVGMPAEFGDKKVQSIPGAHTDRLGTRRFIKLGKLSKRLGANF